MIKYSIEQDPTENGVYACRVVVGSSPFFEDIFLLRMDGQWWHLGSDCKYRRDVAGWIGPLQRKMNLT